MSDPYFGRPKWGVEMSISASEARKTLFPLIERVHDDREGRSSSSCRTPPWTSCGSEGRWSSPDRCGGRGEYQQGDHRGRRHSRSGEDVERRRGSGRGAPPVGRRDEVALVQGVTGLERGGPGSGVGDGGPVRVEQGNEGLVDRMGRLAADVVGQVDRAGRVGEDLDGEPERLGVGGGGEY